jgi:hypothetical protein
MNLQTQERRPRPLPLSRSLSARLRSSIRSARRAEDSLHSDLTSLTGPFLLQVRTHNKGFLLEHFKMVVIKVRQACTAPNFASNFVFPAQTVL